MRGADRRSNCSSGVEVDFYWHDCVDPRGHIEAAVDALMAAVCTPERRWNPFHLRMIRAEFRVQLAEAAKGLLVPVDQVKPIGRGGDVLFEMRWEHLNVTEVVVGDDGDLERDADGAVVLSHRTTRARLLHAEPLPLSVCAVGLHAHEKLVLDTEYATRAAQNEEIDTALRVYNAGAGAQWGLRP